MHIWYNCFVKPFYLKIIFAIYYQIFKLTSSSKAKIREEQTCFFKEICQINTISHSLCLYNKTHSIAYSWIIYSARFQLILFRIHISLFIWISYETLPGGLASLSAIQVWTWRTSRAMTGALALKITRLCSFPGLSDVDLGNIPWLIVQTILPINTSVGGFLMSLGRRLYIMYFISFNRTQRV